MKVYNILCIFIIVIVLFTIQVSSWADNTLRIPEQCYQESANVSDKTGIDDYCYQVYNKNYGGTRKDKEAYDGDWATGEGYVTGSFLVNYSKPNIPYLNGAIWQVKRDTAVNNTIPNICFNQSVIQLKFNFLTGAGLSSFQCYNGTSFQNLTITAGDSSVLYEEAIIWNISSNATFVSENFTIQSNRNYTRYIQVPASSGFITNAFINISALFPGGSLMNGLKAYWAFESNSSKVFTDYLGLYNGTINDSTDTIILGKNKNAMQGLTPGTGNTFWNTTYKPNGSDNSFNFWANSSDFSSVQLLQMGECDVSGGSGGALGQQTFRTFPDTNNRLAFNWRTNFGPNTITTTDNALTNNQWNMITITTNSSTANIYVNGLKNATGASGAPGTILLGNNTNYTLYPYQRHPGGCGTNGIVVAIDEFGVWNRTLNDSEVSSLYSGNAGKFYPNFVDLQNVSLLINNTVVFNQSGNYVQSNYTSIVTAINSFLVNCNVVNGFCLVPTIFHADTFGILQYLNLLFNDNGIITNNATYDANTFETSYETFILNYSKSNSIIATTATFNYNGSTYPSTTSCISNTCSATSSIDIPIITGLQQNLSFYWNVVTFNGSTSFNINSSTFTQGVSSLNFTQCDNGNIALNFTAYDEQNKTRLKPFDFEANFQFYTGSGTVVKNISISNATTNEMNFCVNRNTTYYLNSIIAYSAPNISVTYPTRNWFYQKYPVSNNTQNVNLYLLKSSSSTSFILGVQDKSVQPVPGVLVNAQRCYPGTNTNETVFISRTDSSGLTVGNFEAETALYQFLITNQSQTLLAVTPCAKIVPQTAPFTILFQLGTGYQSPFLNINNLTDINESLVFNYTNNILTFTYIDTSGNFSQAELVVKSLNFSGSSQPIVCDSTNNVSSGIITCNVSTAGSYVAQAYIYRTNGILVDQINFIVQTLSSTFGYYGAFLGFFIILICGFAFKFNEIAGIWLVNAGVLFCNMTGLIGFGYVFITAMLCVSIIITAVMER